MSTKHQRRKLETHRDAADAWNGILSVAKQDKLAAGDQLPSVRDMAERLGLKPTMVRDALLRAQARGVVRIVPRVGAFLETTSPAARVPPGSLEAAAAAALESVIVGEAHHLLHLLDTRRVIEVELIGRAVERRRLGDGDAGWAWQWENGSLARRTPRHVPRWQAGDHGSLIYPPE